MESNDNANKADFASLDCVWSLSSSQVFQDENSIIMDDWVKSTSIWKCQFKQLKHFNENALLLNTVDF